MVSIFWDRKGILLVDFMPPGATINAAAYCDTLTWLRQAIQNTCCHVACACSTSTRGPIPRTPPLHLWKNSSEVYWTIRCTVQTSRHLFLHLKKHLAGKSLTTMMRCKMSWHGSKGRQQTSVTRYRSWFQDLINVWTMPATMLKNKVMYRQFI